MTTYSCDAPSCTSFFNLTAGCSVDGRGWFLQRGREGSGCEQLWACSVECVIDVARAIKERPWALWASPVGAEGGKLDE